MIHYIFAGIFAGVILERYILPALDLMFDVYRYKQTDRATTIGLDTQAQTLEFARYYPEFNQSQGMTEAIGFKYAPSSQEDYDCDEECKGQIGFIK